MNARKRHVMSRLGFLSLSLVLVLAAGGAAVTATAPGNPGVYTLDADFDQGTLVNVNHSIADQLQLDSVATPFEFIWVAASGRGTIIKIDTRTGAILGEYWSAPNGMGRNPSRTTVDGDGNVWAGNRDEANGERGSVVHIGLEENGQCVDRNTNGTIETSTGLGDIKSWSNAGSADTNGGVTTAEDECIIHYVRTAGTNVRTVAVDGSNNVWVGGLGNQVHELLELQRQRCGWHPVPPELRRIRWPGRRQWCLVVRLSESVSAALCPKYPYWCLPVSGLSSILHLWAWQGQQQRCLEHSVDL